MILVDTSVIIDFLRNRQNAKVEVFDDVMESKIPWGISEFVYQEVLQGARDEKEFGKLREYFDTVPVYFLKYGKVSFERAAMLNLRCRSAGVTVRSTVDLLIVETAIENEVFLLHNDSDFTYMAGVLSELRLYKERIT